MTKAYISEYARGTLDGRTFIPSAEEPSLASQVVDYTAGAAVSTLLNAKTRFVRIHVDSIASFKVSTAGTLATTADARMAANATEYFGVPNSPLETGSNMKFSFITNT